MIVGERIMVDILQGVLTGFATGLGAGAANYFIIKRLEKIEKRIQEKMNGFKSKESSLKQSETNT